MRINKVEKWDNTGNTVIILCYVIDIKALDASVKEDRNNRMNEMDSGRIDVANALWECRRCKK